MLQNILLAGVIFSAVTASAESALNTEWFVNNAIGKDSNSGKSIKQPFRTFAKAMKAARRSDTLNIAKTTKTYYQSLILVGNLGTAAAPFVVNGNGAVISGLRFLDKSKWKKQGEAYFYPLKMSSNCHARLFINGKSIKEFSAKETCGPGGFQWLKGGFFFIPDAGKTISDYNFQASIGNSGIVCIHAKNVIVRDIISEHHANDGFNMHGSCHSLFFENITGRNNGDDGFSIHEDGEVYVRGGEFYGNHYGIEDVNAARSFYNGIKVYNNAVGVHFAGGSHSLVASTIYNNREMNILINAGAPSSYLGKDRSSAIFDGECFVKNTVVRNGIGIVILKRSKVSIIKSAFKDCKIGIKLKNGAECFLNSSLILDCKQAFIQEKDAIFKRECNLYYPDNFSINGVQKNLKNHNQLGNDLRSTAVKPKTWGSLRLRSKTQPFIKQSPKTYLGPEL